MKGQIHTAVTLHPGKSPQCMTGCSSNVYMVVKSVPFLFQESKPDCVVIQPIIICTLAELPWFQKFDM